MKIYSTCKRSVSAQTERKSLIHEVMKIWWDVPNYQLFCAKFLWWKSGNTSCSWKHSKHVNSQLKSFIYKAFRYSTVITHRTRSFIFRSLFSSAPKLQVVGSENIFGLACISFVVIRILRSIEKLFVVVWEFLWQVMRENESKLI